MRENIFSSLLALPSRNLTSIRPTSRETVAESEINVAKSRGWDFEKDVDDAPDARLTTETIDSGKRGLDRTLMAFPHSIATLFPVSNPSYLVGREDASRYDNRIRATILPTPLLFITRAGYPSITRDLNIRESC